MTNPCNRAGCKAEATGRVCLKLWAKGYPKWCFSPILFETGLTLCDEHQKELEPVNQFLADEVKATIVNALRRHKKADPDFKTAEWWFKPPDAPTVLDPIKLSN